ncbi:MAG: 2-phospho-L-lactate guanylyltransferase [Halobacteriales archaeon]
MRVVVPYDVREPKTRLSTVLSAAERAAFARAMLDDVLAAVRAAGGDPELLATGPVDAPVPTTVDRRPLTRAVNAVLAAADGPVAVVMADLALATPAALRRLFETDGEVVLVPGRGGGTNALVARHPAFRVDYHGVSYRDHRRAAREAGADVATVDSYWLSTDVDDPADLPEVLLHGDGAARTWLQDAGFELSVEEGRVGIARDD